MVSPVSSTTIKPAKASSAAPVSHQKKNAASDLPSVYEQAFGNLLQIGFDISASQMTLNEYKRAPDGLFVFAVVVNDDRAKAELPKQISPELIVVDKDAPKAPFVVFVPKESISLIELTTERYYGKKIDFSTPSGKKMFQACLRLIASGDEGILRMISGDNFKSEAYKKFPSLCPLKNWNIMLGAVPVKMAPYPDFSPSPAKTPAKLWGQAEDFIAAGAGYRVKDMKKFAEMINADAVAQGLNIATMSPKQALDFAASVVEHRLEYLDDLPKMDTLEYINAAVSKPRSERPKDLRRLARIIDNYGVDELLAGGKGVCRHYATAYVAVFDYLKANNNNLKNIYCSGVISNDHEWVLVMSVEKGPDGGTFVRSSMIDPTKDDDNKAVADDLDASEQAANKYATAQMLLRLGRKQELQELIDENPDDIEFMNMAADLLIPEGGRWDIPNENIPELFGEYKNAIEAILKNKSCDESAKINLTTNLAYSYIEMGQYYKAYGTDGQATEMFRKAEATFRSLLVERNMSTDGTDTNKFYATLYFAEEELDQAEFAARKIKDDFSGKMILAKILAKDEKYDEALKLLKEIDGAYDRSECKLQARLLMADIYIATKNEVFARTKGDPKAIMALLGASDKLCATEADRFSLLLAKARVAQDPDEKKKYYEQLIDEHFSMFKGNLIDFSSTVFKLDDIIWLNEVDTPNKAGLEKQLQSFMDAFQSRLIAAHRSNFHRTAF